MQQPPRTPVVTVVVPVHERRESLLPSVASVLGQTFTDFELLVTDDGSGADFAALLAGPLQDPRLEILRSDANQGPAAARNRGIARARGQYIAFLDSDDVWLPEKLERQLTWIVAQPRRPRISCTGYRIVTPFHPDGEVRLARRSRVKFDDLLWGCGISPGSTMVADRSLFEEVGLFDESLRRLEDWDWLLRCVQKTPIAVIPEVLAVVHVRRREDFPLEDVCDSASLIESYMAQGRYSLEPGQRNIMLSTLHSEMAAAAFRRRRYGRAATSMLQSMYHNSFRPAGYYRRILSALKHDLFDRN